MRVAVSGSPEAVELVMVTMCLTCLQRSMRSLKSEVSTDGQTTPITPQASEHALRWGLSRRISREGSLGQSRHDFPDLDSSSTGVSGESKQSMFQVSKCKVHQQLEAFTACGSDV